MTRAPGILAALLLAGPVVGCGKGAHETGGNGGAGPGNAMDVTAVAQTFQAPDSVRSGWITFRFTNTSDMTHFALIEKLPDGKGIADQQAEVAPVFQAGLDLLNAGKPEEASETFTKLPAWFGRIEFLGGPGFLGPGRTEETTVHLDPGTYLLECYVKTVGVFHSYNPDPGQYGMVHQFEVTGSSAAPEPRADATVTISSQGGIRTDADLRPGLHTIAVHFEDQKPHENFVDHDVHLVRLAPDTDLAELGAWMDWTRPSGLEVPAPAEFLGGVNEMPAGSTGYLTVTLEPGQYAWIAEVPDPEDKGMLETFTVRGEE